MTSANARNVDGARCTGYRLNRARTCVRDAPAGRNDFTASNCAAPPARAIGPLIAQITRIIDCGHCAASTALSARYTLLPQCPSRGGVRDSSRAKQTLLPLRRIFSTNVSREPNAAKWRDKSIVTLKYLGASNGNLKTCKHERPRQP